MRYKVGNKAVTISNRAIEITGIDEFHCLSYWFKYTDFGFGKNYTIREQEIDHEATAKLNTLPQPHKSMLRSGMKVVYKNKSFRYVLLETGTLHDDGGNITGLLNDFSSELLVDPVNMCNIMQIWDGDTLIAQRTEKSEAELKKESILAKIAELQAEVDKL